MNKLLLVIQREFLTRVKSKAFIILTLAMPVIAAIVLIAPLLLSQIQSDDIIKIGYLDKTCLYDSVFQNTEKYQFEKVTKIDKDLDYNVIVAISDTLTKNPESIKLYSKEEITPEVYKFISNKINEKVYEDKLAKLGIPEIETIIENLKQEVEIQTVKWSDKGEEKETSTDGSLLLGITFTTLIYMFIMIYGSMVMQGVLEEKTSRIIEIMVSSVKPFQLMLGKIIGIMLVGLFQLAIWAIMLFMILQIPAAIMSGNEVNGENGILQMIMNLPIIETFTMFMFCFIGGYFLYASIFAAIGASVNSNEESQQFMTPVMLLMIFGIYAAMYSLNNINGPLAFWASLFPLTSPIVILIRVPFGIPIWQELLSMVILYGTAFFTLWIAAKIYRVGILMYGKKPTIKEILKWIRFK